MTASGVQNSDIMPELPARLSSGVLTRFIETVERNLISPAFASWRVWHEESALTDASADRMRVLAQAEVDVEAIKAGKAIVDPRTRQVVRLDAESAADLPLHDPLWAAESSAAARLLREEVNVAKTLILAGNIVANEPEGLFDSVEVPVDEDWLHKWRANAAGVSSDQLREFWARLLVEEHRAPGTYSLRLQSFLSTISTADAKLIATLMTFDLNGSVCAHESVKPLLNASGLPYGQLLELEDLGVIIGVQSLGLVVQHKSMLPDQFLKVIPAGDRAIVVKAADANLTFKLPTYKLTGTARQLKMLGTFKRNEEYLRLVGLEIAKKPEAFEVLVADLTHFEGTKVGWKNGVRIEAPTSEVVASTTQGAGPGT
jgi:hypothetical protein